MSERDTAIAAGRAMTLDEPSPTIRLDQQLGTTRQGAAQHFTASRPTPPPPPSPPSPPPSPPLSPPPPPPPPPLPPPPPPPPPPLPPLPPLPSLSPPPPSPPLSPLPLPSPLLPFFSPLFPPSMSATHAAVQAETSLRPSGSRLWEEKPGLPRQAPRHLRVPIGRSNRVVASVPKRPESRQATLALHHGSRKGHSPGPGGESGEVDSPISQVPVQSGAHRIAGRSMAGRAQGCGGAGVR